MLALVLITTKKSSPEFPAASSSGTTVAAVVTVAVRPNQDTDDPMSASVPSNDPLLAPESS